MLPNSLAGVGGGTNKTVCSSPVGGTRELGLKCGTHMLASFQTQVPLCTCPINFNHLVSSSPMLEAP